MLGETIADTPELKKPVPTMTIIFVLVIGGLGWLLGGAQMKLSMQDDYFKEKMEDAYKYIDQQHGFAIDEVGGVRADMDKEDGHLNEAIKAVESKISRKHDAQQIMVDENKTDIKNLKRPNSDR